MTPQFVDFNADGFQDVVVGTYSGSPHVAFGSSNGYESPQYILNSAGEPIHGGMYQPVYGNENASAIGFDSEDVIQFTAAAAFDWDGDGDYDLLLGNKAAEGQPAMHVCINEGTSRKPAFATEYVAVMNSEGKPLEVDGKMTAMQVIDWDGDGMKDILAGSSGGGVAVYRNAGKPGEPSFAPAAVIMTPPAGAGVPRGVWGDGSSALHAYAHDVDRDGTLDLLVGGTVEIPAQPIGLSDVQRQQLLSAKAEVERLGAEMEALRSRASEKYETMSEEEVGKKLAALNEEVFGHMDLIHGIEGRPDLRHGVWYYRGKATGTVIKPVRQRPGGG